MNDKQPIRIMHIDLNDPRYSGIQDYESLMRYVLQTLVEEEAQQLEELALEEQGMAEAQEFLSKFRL